MVRAAARDDERVGHQVEVALDQIAAYGRQRVERTLLRTIDRARSPGLVVSQKCGPRILARPQKDRVGVLGRLLRQRNAAHVGGSTDAEIETWELPLATVAAEVVLARREGAKTLAQSFADVWDALSAESAPEIVIEYRSESWSGPSRLNVKKK